MSQHFKNARPFNVWQKLCGFWLINMTDGPTIGSNHFSFNFNIIIILIAAKSSSEKIFA